MKARKYRLALLFIPLLIANVAAAPRITIVNLLFVKAGGMSSGSCDSWGTACDLQFALYYAAIDSGDDVIWVKQGTYKPTTTTDPTRSFVLQGGVSIYGGFAGTETLFSQRNWVKHVTTLSGDIGNSGYAPDDSYHVVTAGAVGTNAVLDGFTISGGYADGSYPDYDGAGIYNNGGSPALTNLIISGNHAISAGGGMYNLGGSPVLTNVTFSGNSAYTFGGGMFNEASNPQITDVTFDGNSTAGGDGGAIYDDQGSPTITNATFHGNSANAIVGDAYGGAMYNYDNSNPTVRNATFSGNSAKTSGGAVYINQSVGNYYNSIFWNDGWEITLFNSTPTIKDSVIFEGCPYGATCIHVIDADPKLGPLQNNGGLTKTMALETGSVALDAGGVNAPCAAQDQRGVSRPQAGKCDIGAYEVRALAFRSVGTNDGWVLESGENTNAGGSMNASATTIRIGDDASNRQYRGVLSFNTSKLPDAAAIVVARLKVKKAGLVGTNPFTTHGTLTLDLKKPFFGTTVGLELGDFETAATTSPAGRIGSALIGGWYSGSLNNAGRASVNKTGPTQLRLRFTLDDNNDHNADYLSLYSGNATPSYRPALVVYYNP